MYRRDRMEQRWTFVIVMMFLVRLSSLLQYSNAEFQKVKHAPKVNGSLSILVVGDWGRKGFYNQTEVAHQMGKVGEKMNIDFVISTGDNFYESGLTGVEDKSFEESFTNIYTAKSLQKQWYSVLGNHDYQGDVLVQLDSALQKKDERWFCKRSFALNAEIAQFVFVDTTPFVMDFWNNSYGEHYDQRDVALRQQFIFNTLKDVDAALKNTTAKWKFVVGHHTIRSVSDGETEELVELLLPVLMSNNVDLYINGHDHCLQHISSRSSPLHFLTSGGGSQAWAGVFTPSSDDLRFFYDGQGFMSLQLTESEVEFAFYDIFGKVLHRHSFNKVLQATLWDC